MTRILAATVLALAAAAAPLAQATEIQVIGALGDSLTAGFNARRLGDNRDLSWSTGTLADVESHLRRLQRRAGPTAVVTAFNEAIAGSVAADLDRQISRLLRRNPDYVTIAIGANDVCTWHAYDPARLDAFEAKLRGAIQRIVTARPTVKVFLAPIPDVYNLWEVAHVQSGCQSKWNLIGMCKPLLAQDRTDLDRQNFQARWRMANDVIAQVAAEFPDHVLHDPGIADTRFEWRHVSPLDCFHPSVAGQNLLAERAWLLD